MPRLSRTAVLAGVMALAFLAVAAQLVRLGLAGGTEGRIALAEPVATVFVRPDIVDRRGRLLAKDVAAPSLFADPSVLLDVDEVAEKIAATLPGFEATELRRMLADRSRRFVWLKRGLTPQAAQAVHDLGLPGLGFRREPKRFYPAGALAGHVLGTVNIDNKGTSGIERHIDDTGAAEAVVAAATSRRPAVRLSLDIGVQFALADELRAAIERYTAAGAAGLVLDVDTGEIVAAASSPEIDPNRPTEALDGGRIDKLTGGVFELGSIWKMLTVALGLDAGYATLETAYDVSEPIRIGRHTISDLHPVKRALTVREIFVRSSNVGAGLMALEAGPERQLTFLASLGLMEPIRTQAGALAAPLLPKTWGKMETVTIGYGHGIALAPLQFAAAAATLLNGGYRVTPTFLARDPAAGADTSRVRVVAAATSAAIRELMRLNVTLANGTGRRADVEGYRLGGKTGTAEMPGEGGYREKAVIASFLGVMPTDAPRWLTLVMLFEPKGIAETGGQITAGVNAAPVTARLVQRIAPLLGVTPRRLEVREAIPQDWFDAVLEQK